MILVTIALLVSTALGSELENARLLQANRVLLNALRELQVGIDEVRVGECMAACGDHFIGDGYCDDQFCDGCDSFTTNGCFDGGDCGGCGDTPQDSDSGPDPYAFTSPNAPNCGELTAYKACTGSQFDLKDWSRYNFGSSPVTEFSGSQFQALCQQRCDNFGVPGCCEYQLDHEICYFYPGTMSTKDDSGYDELWSTTSRQMITWPKRHSSICNIPNCEYTMVTMTPRLDAGEMMSDVIGLCDYRNLDKFGHKVTSTSSATACNDLCLADPDCYVAAYRSGECNRFITCSSTMPDGKGTFIMAQKVCKGAEEEFNVPMPNGYGRL